MKLQLALLSFGTFIAGFASSAFAQQNHGFSASVAFGPGVTAFNGSSSDGATTSPAGVFRLGWAINTRLVVGLEASAHVWDSRRNLGNGNLGASVSWWPIRNANLFLSGGMGRAVSDVEVEAPGVVRRERGLGWTGSVGYDVRIAGSLYLVPSLTAMVLDAGPARQGFVLTTLGLGWH